LEQYNVLFYYFEIRPLPLPSPKERVIELRVDKILFKIIVNNLFPITHLHSKAFICD